MSTYQQEQASINMWDYYCELSKKEQQQKDILHSQSVWKIYFGAVLQDIREPNWREEEKEQYKKVCDEEDCDTILDIDTDIMCYMNKQNGDKTLCRECYEDGGYKELDENSDNEDSDDEDDEEEEEENTCWGNNKCERDEFGCCIVCCECKECIKRIKEE